MVAVPTRLMSTYLATNPSLFSRTDNGNRRGHLSIPMERQSQIALSRQDGSNGVEEVSSQGPVDLSGSTSGEASPASGDGLRIVESLESRMCGGLGG